jgi:hypothetical protein
MNDIGELNGGFDFHKIESMQSSQKTTATIELYERLK